jgi:hypothetical protein
MTRFSDEFLMAFADNELEESVRVDLQRAMASDAALAERLRAQTSLRERLQSAYRPVLDEPMPARLLRAAQAPPPLHADLVNLEEARQARDIERASLRAQNRARWGGMAASLLLGLVMGWFMQGGDAALVAETVDGQLEARGAVDRALSTRLASEAGGKAAIQLSFVDKAGDYCRTFTTAKMAGLACRHDHTWVVNVLAMTEATAATPMRQAATALPMAVLQAVDQRIQGSPLDAAGEQAAQRQGWQRR